MTFEWIDSSENRTLYISCCSKTMLEKADAKIASMGIQHERRENPFCKGVVFVFRPESFPCSEEYNQERRAFFDWAKENRQLSTDEGCLCGARLFKAES